VPVVSVVIPCYNAMGDLPEQLEALAASTDAPPFEVLLADNGSNDGMEELVQHFAPRFPQGLRRVPAHGTRGVAHARNAGCRAAAADRILICDADDLVSPQWVVEMCKALDSADIVGGTLSSERVNQELPRAWRRMPPPGSLPVKLRHLPYAVGANTGLRREVFEAVGGWDEAFVGGGDDVEFAWRAQHRGFTLAAAPEAVIYYRLRETVLGTARQAYTYAKSDAQLLVKFEAAGVRRTELMAPFREAVRLVLSAKQLVGPRGRGAWVRRFAMFAGRIAGSLEHRAWAL